MAGNIQILWGHAHHSWQLLRHHRYFPANWIWEIGWWITAFGGCLWLFTFPRSPGLAAVILAGLAALLAFIQMNTRQKLLGSALILAVVAVEIRAINSDRANQNEKTRVFQTELKSNFEMILKQNQEAFAKTQDHIESVIEQARITFQNITGGEAYAYIVPQVHGLAENSAIPLVVWNGGDYPLNGLTIRIIKVGEGRPPSETYSDLFNGQTAVIPVLPPHEFEPLKGFFVPQLGPDGIGNYQVQLSAQNGRVNQMLQFRHGKNGMGWGVKFFVTKQYAVPGQLNTYTQKVLKEADWSDDLVPDVLPQPK